MNTEIVKEDGQKLREWLSSFQMLTVYKNRNGDIISEKEYNMLHDLMEHIESKSKKQQKS